MVRYNPNYKGIRIAEAVDNSTGETLDGWKVWIEPPAEPRERERYNTARIVTLNEALTLLSLDSATREWLRRWADHSADDLIVMEGDVVYYLVTDYRAIKVEIIQIRTFGGHSCSHEVIKPNEATIAFKALQAFPEHSLSIGDKSTVSAGGHNFVPRAALKVKRTGLRKVSKFRMLTGTYT